MTTRNYFQTYLEQRGMSSNQAIVCTDFCIEKFNAEMESNESFNGYKITWDKPSDEYPSVVIRTVIFMMHAHVLEWISLNIPNAWFRAIFDNSISE